MHTLAPRTETVFRPAAAFEILSNPTRRRLLDVLRLEGPTELLELADHLGISSLKLYNHIELLEEAGLVRVRELAGERFAKFSAVGWARLKRQWQRGMSQPRSLVSAV